MNRLLLSDLVGIGVFESQSAIRWNSKVGHFVRNLGNIFPRTDGTNLLESREPKKSLHFSVTLLSHIIIIFSSFSSSSSTMMLRTSALRAIGPLRRTPALTRLYHEKVIDHYERPRNVGSMPKNDVDVGTGLYVFPLFVILQVLILWI